MFGRAAGLAAAAVLLCGTATGASAQRFGVQGSWADDTDFAIGARIELDLPVAQTGVLARTFAIGSFDWFFPDCEDDVGLGDTEIDCTYWEANANLAAPLTTGAGMRPYAGAGLNIARFSIDAANEIGDFDDSETEVGLNLLGGLRFLLGGLSAYAEARAEIGGGEQFVVTIGALFGGR